MDRLTRKKTDIRPKKICRSDGCYWIPNPCINEHYLTQRLGELDKHEEIYNANYRKRQKEIQRELLNIRASKDTKNGAGYFRRKETIKENPKPRKLSLTEMIDKFKMKRVENDLLNELIKQQRRGSQTIDKSIRERSPSKLWEIVAAAKADDIGPRRESKDLSILDEMKASLDTARRLSSESSWDEIFDTVRKERKRNSDPTLRKQNDVGHEKRHKTHRRRNTLHADKTEKDTKRIERPRKINGERTSIVQLSMKRRTPIYAENYSSKAKLKQQKHKTKPKDSKPNLGLVRERTLYPEDMKRKSRTTSVVSNKDNENRTNKVTNKSKTEKANNITLDDENKEIKDIGSIESTNGIIRSKYLKKNKVEEAEKLNNSKNEANLITTNNNNNNNNNNNSNNNNNVQNTFNNLDEVKEHIVLAEDAFENEDALASKDTNVTSGSKNEVQSQGGREVPSELSDIGGLVREPTEMIFLLPDENEKEIYGQKFEEKLKRIKNDDIESGLYQEDSFVECDVHSLESQETWDDVKRCRYLRGYDPPEMIMPKGEINVFVFGRDENDILELKRQNETSITGEVKRQNETSITGEVPLEVEVGRIDSVLEKDVSSNP